MLSAMAGWDPKDSTSARERVPRFERGITGGVKKLKIGIDSSFCFSGVDDEVAAAVRKSLELLEGLGARVVEVTLPNIELTSVVESVIITAEAAAYHEDNLRNRGADYGDDVRVLLEAGAAFTAVHYLKAQRLRRMIQGEFAAVFKKIDVFAMPGAAVPAPPIGAETVTVGGMGAPTETALLRFTCPSNLTGLPAVSAPCGLNCDGLPMGLQLIGRAFDEATLLRVAHAFEANSEPFPKPNL
jgi:aspartyl-tRNA(Asn)/glutamyl-tRNA(Gln) amidotransferase subunit A